MIKTIVLDFDGVVVIPKGLEEKILTLAKEKVGKESLSRKALLEGKTLREVYNTYGVL